MSHPAALTLAASAIADALRAGPLPESQLLNNAQQVPGADVLTCLRALRLAEERGEIRATRAHPAAERLWSLAPPVTDPSDSSDPSA